MKTQRFLLAAGFALALAFTVSCSGDDGSDGAPGSQGEQGVKGDSGAKGDDGADGQDGKDGQSCVTSQDKNGSITITCGTSVAVVMCGGELFKGATTHICDLRNGQQYGFAKIGDQTWLTENLNYAGETGSIGGCYDNSTSNCNTYGRLYIWDEAMDNLCPTGWKLPSKEDWEEALEGDIDDLGLQYGGQASASDGGYYTQNTEGYFWSETPSTTIPTRAFYLVISSSSKKLENNTKLDGFSVRCLKK